MIARIWRGRTRPEHADEYAEYVGETGVVHHRETSGNRGSMVFQRKVGEDVEILVVSLWESLDHVRDFAGEDPEVAVYFPEDEKYLLELEPKVRHYDVSVFEMDLTIPEETRPAPST